MKQFDKLYLILLRLRRNPKPASGKNPTRPVKTCPHPCKVEFYKVCAEWCRKRKEKGGGSLQPGYNTCEQYKKRGTVSPGNGGGSPFCRRGLRRQNDESQNVMLTVWNSITVLSTDSEEANTTKQRNDIRPVALKRLTVSTSRIKSVKIHTYKYDNIKHGQCKQ